MSEAAAQRCSANKMYLEISQNSQENNCARVSFAELGPATLLAKTLAQVFSCEFREISKNTFSCRTPPVAASGAAINLLLTL